MYQLKTISAIYNTVDSSTIGLNVWQSLLMSLAHIYNNSIFLSTIAIAVFYAFGQGTGPVFLNNIICTGTESSVLDCNYTWPDVHQCSHLADGGVVCPPCKYMY